MSAANATRISNYTRPVDLLEIARRGERGVRADKTSKASFHDMFSAELASNRDVQFSKHASQRLFSRGIELTDDKLDQIARAIDKASEKGSRETLILTDEAALIVSVENRTVVTAFDRDNLREGVVTSIDSAVIL